MTTLFTLSESWFNRPALYEQLAFARTGDSILLIQDAVLSLHSPISLASFSAKCHVDGIDVYALADDCKYRGIENQYSLVREIGFQEFVDLVVKHDKQVAW